MKTKKTKNFHKRKEENNIKIASARSTIEERSATKQRNKNLETEIIQNSPKTKQKKSLKFCSYSFKIYAEH